MCNNRLVSIINLQLQPGLSIFQQLVTASVKAFVTGEFKEGQAFPSVRTLAADFKIHPNTAQKVIQHLIRERFLEVHPGIGTVVAKLPTHVLGIEELLQAEAEKFALEAIRLGANLSEAIRMVEAVWAAEGLVEEKVTHDRRK
jgi:GntR family transcriptional regulator